MAVGDVVREDDQDLMIVWDGSKRCPSLLGERRERTAEIYQRCGFEISQRAPWKGPRQRRAESGES